MTSRLFLARQVQLSPGFYRPGLFVAVATAAALLVRMAALLRYGKVDTIFIGKRRLQLRYFW